MKIAALYARVSSAKQQLNENIASQIAAIQEYARQNDFQISPQHVYKDDGFSGARLDRPALDRLRDAVAQGEVEAVLILSPDRLARQFALADGGFVNWTRRLLGDSKERLMTSAIGAELICRLFGRSRP
jgi:DNA invertase Pin-like site-specific DNA recombinase